MTDYPYNFGNGYKVQTVFANKTESGVYGDIYDFRSEVERAHPGAEIMVGYCVIDEALGLIPDACNDWNDTIPDAIQDYEEHVVPFLETPLEFVFDEEITVSEDGYLEGYVWAMDSLVARLQAQEPPLAENEWMENINFYPVYNVANHTVTMEGHYWLEGEHTARGVGFTLPLSKDESENLLTAFEAYCLKEEGMTCAAFLKNVLSSSEPSLKAVDIQWDVDDPSDLEELPTEMEIPSHISDEDEISEYITAETGFCHKGFRVVEIKEAEKEALFEHLKSALFMAGNDAIEDFLGYEIDPDEDKDVTDRRMDIERENMPEDEMNRYFAKYNIGQKASLSEQIQSASTRADESKSSAEAPTKDFAPEK